MKKKNSSLVQNLIVIVCLLAAINIAMCVCVFAKSTQMEIVPQEVTIPLETAAATQATEETVLLSDMEEETVPAEDETVPAVVRMQYDAVPLYFQTDYPDDLYGQGTIESSGCSITSLAMVASYMTNHEYLPDELAEYFGGYGETNVQKLEYASDMLQLPWKKASNVHEVIRAVRSGDLAIILMNHKSIFTDSQHFIVVAGVTEDGKLILRDPYEPNYSKWDLKRAFEVGFEDGDIVCGYSGGWVYDMDAMPEDPFIYVENKPYVEPRYPGVELSQEDIQLLAKVIWVESRGEPARGQQAIAEVVLNRLVSDDFPDSVRDVLYQDNQFRSINFIKDATPTQAQYDAIEDALNGPYVMPMDVMHFATYPVNNNVWGVIGGHVFCYQWEDSE